MNSILYQDSALNSFRLSRISRIEAEVPFTGLGIKYVGSGREVYFANDRKYREEAGSYLIGNDFTRSIVHINSRSLSEASALIFLRKSLLKLSPLRLTANQT